MKGPLGVERVRMPLFASKSSLSTIGAVTVTEGDTGNLGKVAKRSQLGLVVKHGILGKGELKVSHGWMC